MWEEYGFRMHIPENALGSSGTAVIAIRMVVAGKFTFPENTEPVSAIYEISTSAKLVKPITLEIQHCVALRGEEDCSYLSFASAHNQSKKPHLPCVFQKLNGGLFSPGSQNGIISCSSFCSMTIVKDSKRKMKTRKRPNTEPGPSSRPKKGRRVSVWLSMLAHSSLFMKGCISPPKKQD